MSDGPPHNPLASPLSALRGIGAERAAQLARLKLQTRGDLLLHRPRRYEDRREFRAVADLQLGEAATARGRIVAQGVKRWRRGTKSVFEFILDDGTGRLHCRWWNLPFMEKYFHTGDEVLVYGKPVSLKPRTIDHPETEIVETGGENFIHLNRLVPIYPLTEGLPQRWLRSLVWRVLEEHEQHIVEPSPMIACRRLAGSCPASGLVPQPVWALSRAQAIRLIHFPEERSDIETARQRLALEEFLDLQLEIQRRRRSLQANARGLPCAGDNRLIKPFLRRLGFPLTNAQTKVLRVIRRDLGGAQPMRRLLQGDVGSGKTVVAACAALMTLESGFGVVLMAPTEILAEQHLETFGLWFGPLGLQVELRTGSRKTADIQRPTSNIQRTGLSPSPTGNPQPATRNPLIIGTHALIESAFAPDNLGLVIIDEQHKFGVAQREKLVRKGRYPHLLVMTATPIPRTLGLTLYGDLDISVIDQLPPGRGALKTFVRTTDKLPKVFEFIRGKLKEGRQAYVVYPRVEESDGGDVKAVTMQWETLRDEFAPHQVGLLHGRLKAAERERIMAEFRANRIQVLVATSIVEVGVDVPNATVMLIENADRFGLAQLHQLRGRIGRGAHESYCVLVADRKTEDAWRRLEVLEETSDGFRIAEEDLNLRGPGEFLGQQQSGLPPFRFGDLAHDRELIECARLLAKQILESAEKS
jgi:ATP-dependent DNA helicase RecG